MPYCIDCGVKLRDDIDSCPLCTRKVEFPAKRKSLPPLYPSEAQDNVFFSTHKTEKDIFFFSILTFLNILVILLLLGIDYIFGRDFSWSKYTSSSLLFSYSVIFFIFVLSSHKFIRYTFINISTCLFLFLLDLFNGSITWFVEFALPSFIIVQLLSLITYLICSKINNRIIKAAIIIFMISVLLNIIDFIILKTSFWSAITSASLLLMAVYLVLINGILRSRV